MEMNYDQGKYKMEKYMKMRYTMEAPLVSLQIGNFIIWPRGKAAAFSKIYCIGAKNTQQKVFNFWLHQFAQA